MLAVNVKIELISTICLRSTVTALALRCVTEFSWQQRKMPELHCGMVCYVALHSFYAMFSVCANYIKACFAFANALRYLLL